MLAEHGSRRWRRRAEVGVVELVEVESSRQDDGLCNRRVAYD